MKKTVNALGFKDSSLKDTPVVKLLLNKSSGGKKINNDSFNCRPTIGSPSCLEGYARPGMSIAAHQADNFSASLIANHDVAVKKEEKIAYHGG